MYPEHCQDERLSTSAAVLESKERVANEPASFLVRESACRHGSALCGMHRIRRLDGTFSIRQAQGTARQNTWTWKPPVRSVKSGDIEILPVRGNVYMLIGAGGNHCACRQRRGAVVDAGLEPMSDKVLAAVRSISKRPISTSSTRAIRRAHWR